MAKRSLSQPMLMLLLTIIIRATSSEAYAVPATTNSPAPRLQTSYSQIPLYFEANQGQADEQVQFLARGTGYTLALTADGVVLTLGSKKSRVTSHKSEDQLRAPSSQSSTIHMQLIGSNANAHVSGVEELPGKANYFVGKAPAQWRRNIPTYAKVKYDQVYPGIDLVYYGNQQQLEYDFIIQPEADPKAICLAFSDGGGVRRAVPLRIDESGDLVIGVSGEKVRFHRPRIYQEIDGVKQPVEGGYILHESAASESGPQPLAPNPQIGFAVAAYDTTKPLIIDPVLSYAVFVAQNSEAVGPKVAVDSSGNVYVSGSTVSTGLPPEASLRPFAGETDIFLAKLDAKGTTLLYATYLGGSNSDEGAGIAVDAEGNAYVTGSTISRDFPTTTGALMPDCPDRGPQSCNSNVFVTKLNAAGAVLVYSTYLGGSGADKGADIAVDAFGNAFVTGNTWSPDFPTQQPFQTWHGHPSCGVTRSVCVDVFVSKLNATGTALVYSSYLGGSGREEGNSIAVDAAGGVYITGFTESIDFPIVNPAQATFGGPIGQAFGDAFVAKVNTSGSGLVYATYLGGSGWDEGRGITVDSLGNAYVTGWTGSTNFPTVNPLPSTGQESFDAFITKVSVSGSTFVYSSRLGGSNQDEGNDIVVDGAGNAYVTGISYSDDFPTMRPLQDRRGGGLCPNIGGGAPCPDAFVTKINAFGNGFVYSTYLGGGAAYSDSGSGIAVDTSGNTYVAGNTSSIDFPAENPFHIIRSEPSGPGDTFIAKIADPETGSIIAYLETPEEGPVSGIAIVRGWAFSTQPGASITEIELLINGRPASEIPNLQLGKIPCCSERPDVRDVFPQFPPENTLQSGWGATINWNWLESSGYQVRVRIRDSVGNLFLTDSRNVGVTKPGGFEFLDQFDLSDATARIAQDPFTTQKDALTVKVEGVAIRDKATQQQKIINAHFRWFTSMQSLGLIQAETMGTSSAQWIVPTAWMAALPSWLTTPVATANAQTLREVHSFFEDPTEGQPVSGVSVIRGWAFPDDTSIPRVGVSLFVDGVFHSDIPCCSARGDVAAAFPDHTNALSSGWGLLYNYGRLATGPHEIAVGLSDSFARAIVTRHNVTVVKPGDFEFLDQFDLGNTTARIDGQEIELQNVNIRDKATQQEKTIDVRLRWFESTQGLGIVATSE